MTLAVTLVLAGAGARAREVHGTPFPGLLLDPFGDFSAVRFPTWPEATPLRFPDPLITVDGRSVKRSTAAPNTILLPAIREQIAATSRAGRSTVELTFEHAGAHLVVTRAVRTFDTDEAAFFYGFHALVALATFASGVMVFLGSARRAAARAYGLWSIGAALFLATFFDYHSTASLTPAFAVGAAATDVGFLWLAWSFPSPPRRLRGASAAALAAASAIFGIAAVLICAAPWLPVSVRLIRVGLSAATPACLLVLVVTLAARVLLATGESRAPLRSAAYGLVTIPALLSAGFVINMLLGQAFLQLLTPLLTPAIPLAIAYSTARHDVLHTEAVLTRKLAFLPVGFFALSLGLLGWLAARNVARPGTMSWLDPVAIGLLITLGVAALGQRLIARLFFRATEAYRPTIDELSERISSLNDEASILAELVRLLSTWLPLDEAQVLTAAEIARAEGLGTDEKEALRLGRKVRRDDALWVPMRFHGELTGAFRLGRKEGGALFTSADLSLLDTMAALGGVALHHAAALREVESLRRSQIHAASEERRGVLDTLSAEIAHELGHPLRYFRALFQDRPAGASLDADEVTFAQHEVERMDRMRRTLETLEMPPPKKEPLALRVPAEHARFLLQDEIAQTDVRVDVDVGDGVKVLAERGPLVQVLVNLLRNAVQAAGRGGRAGVRARADERGLAIEVWDEGPGVPEEVKGTLFRVWGITTRKGGRGLGLMVCSRIVHQLHWTLDFGREGGRTVFRVMVPAADVVTE